MSRRLFDDLDAPAGIFHYAGNPSTTWAEFASGIFELANPDQKPRIVPVLTADYGIGAPRPLNCVLDCTKIQRLYGIAQPDWRAGLRAALTRITGDRST